MAPKSNNQDPYKNGKYILEMNGMKYAVFSECKVYDPSDSISAPLESIEISEKDGVTASFKLSLKKGIALQPQRFMKWVSQSLQENEEVEGLVLMVDGDPQFPKSWAFFNAYVLLFEVANPPGDPFKIETLDLSIDRLQKM